MKRKLIAILSICLVAAFVGTGTLLSQATRGSISGAVVDESKGAVPGATLSLTNQGSGQVFTKVSTDTGQFSFPALTPGMYTLRVTMDGFKTFVARDIKVDVGKDFSVSAKLELGEISTEVIVTSGSEIIAQSDAQISTTIGKKQIDMLPLNGRNPLNLITLNAGSAANGRTNTVINGNRTSFTSISLDGVNIQDNFIRSNSTDFVPARPTVSTVGEFTITTATQGSDSGFGSNQVNFVTPSGSNAYHGEVYWYHRNDATGANDFFNNRDGVAREALIRNQFGFTVSGPAIKDRLLFFWNYEGQRIRNSSRANATLPLDSLRQGIFRYTRTDDGSIGEVNLLQLAGIPADPFLQTIFARSPSTPNNFNNGDSSAGALKNTAGFSFNQKSDNDRNQYKFRLDYIINDSHSIEGTYQWLKNTDLRDDIDGTYNEVPVAKSGTGGAFSDFISTAWKWNVTPSMLNEVRFGAFLSPVLFTTDETFPEGFKVTSLGFTNPVEDFEEQGRVTDTYTFQDNASWQRGNHSFRFGFQSNLIRVKSFACFDCVAEYAFGLSTQQTVNLTSNQFPGGISSSELSTARDLMATLGGLLTTGTQDFAILDPSDPTFVTEALTTNWEYDTYAFYFGDNWRVNPRLTFNMGLRWEYTPNLREGNNLIVQVIPQSGQNMSQALLDPNAVFDFLQGDLVNKDLNNFAPSLGLAWDLFGDSKTVLRLGYSIAYVNDEAIRSTDTWLNRFGIDENVTLTNLTDAISVNRPGLSPPTFELPLSLNTIAARDPSGKGTFGIDQDLKLPYVQSWNFGIQREVGWDTALEFRYVGTKGTGLRRGVDLNQVEVLNNGFLEDFLRARNNGFLAQAAGLGFDPRFNPNVAGSQELPIFGALPGGGFLTAGIVRTAIQQGAVGQTAFIYISNNLTGGFPFNPNPNANFSDIAVNQASSIYHGLQVEARRRFKGGLQFNMNYTFSKVLTDSPGTGQTNFEPFVDINNPGYDRGRSSFDLTHAFNTNLIYELPFGRGRKFDISNGWVNNLIGGWNITSIFNYQSGQPFSIVSGRGTLNRNGRSGENRANSTLDNAGIRDLFGITESNDRIFWINPNGITGPDTRAVAPDGQAPFAGQVFFHPEPGTLGGVPRNAFNGPNFFNWDFGVTKDFTVTEDVGIEFRAEFFNFLNNVNFNPPSTFGISSTNFGQITSTSGNPRIVQFALKVKF